MLALTGAQADGWLPSQAYAAPDALPDMNARIDDAAHAAGRPLSAIRRLYNLTPGQRPEQLAALAVARSAAGVEADAVLDGVVDDEARGAQAVTRLADQWRGGDAVGHLSHVGGSKDGGDGGSQIAR